MTERKVSSADVLRRHPSKICDICGIYGFLSRYGDRPPSASRPKQKRRQIVERLLELGRTGRFYFEADGFYETDELELRAPGASRTSRTREFEPPRLCQEMQRSLPAGEFQEYAPGADCGANLGKWVRRNRVALKRPAVHGLLRASATVDRSGASDIGGLCRTIVFGNQLG